jgi:hypothetical protein
MSFLGQSSAKFVNDTPLKSKDNVGKSQYHRQQWDKTFLPWIHSITNALVKQTSQVGLHVNLLYDRFVKACLKEMNVDNPSANFRRYCHLSILTLGNKSSLGFANTCHVDKHDSFKDDFQDTATMIIQKLKDTSCRATDFLKIINYLESLKKLGPFGITTVCGYQKLVWCSDFDDDHLFGYFLNIGLGTCYELNSGMFHCFYGHLFSHQTAVPIIVKNNVVVYNHNSVKLFGWGGGSASQRRG